MANRLAGATSPYLLQHSGNPVDWYEWGDEALGRARTEQKPILLSVGYAACHWCHVMERESFEDPATAAAMNAGFVCIKVDREERPDIDAVYMDALQAMTGQGGWPMTVFLTPALEPFYAGTYFPPEDRHGLPGFRRLLAAIREAWEAQRGDLEEQGRRVAAAVAASGSLGASEDPLTEDLLSAAVRELEQALDPRWGGFSAAPKFPQPMLLELLLRAHARGDARALAPALLTLDSMAAGGICDQLGGGFHRYSTDGRWLVPHFEKMLYDNAQLALVYLHAFQVTGDAAYSRVVRETLDYLLREMRSPGGAFFSAQDADSEGVEGRYFTWPYAELSALGVADLLGAIPSGNWEGTNVPWLPGGIRGDRLPPETAGELLERRGRRVRPATDDKVLAAWNGLAIQAFAEAARVLGEPRYATAAAEAAAFVLESMRPLGRLQRAWREGRSSGPGFADDHAALIGGCLALWESDFDARWYEAAIEVAGELVRLFADERGGFFQTGSDVTAPLARVKEVTDNAVPSGNSLAAEALGRLARLSGDAKHARAAAGALHTVRPLMERAPLAVATALGALDLHLGPTRELAVSGDPGSDPARALLEVARTGFRPRLVVAAGPPSTPVPLLAGREPGSEGAAAYVCEGFTCRLPTSDPAELARQLGEAAAAG